MYTGTRRWCTFRPSADFFEHQGGDLEAYESKHTNVLCFIKFVKLPINLEPNLTILVVP
jgi:hypothetical protein